MARHDRADARGDGRAEGNEFRAFKLVRDRRERRRRARCESTLTLPWPGKCFAVASAPFSSTPRTNSRDVFRHVLRIFAERADVDDRVVGIVVDVRIRREDPVHAGGARFERGVFAGGVGELRIARGADGHGGRERRAFVEAHPGAGLEIRADQQRNFRAALKFVRHHGGRIDLAALDSERPAIGDDDQAADVIVLDLCSISLYSGLSVELKTPK